MPNNMSYPKETQLTRKQTQSKTYNLCIINGRKTGDHLGNLTSFQWGGGGGDSVIDYVIASQSLFQNILSFSVGEYKPWISDHCPINVGKMDRMDSDLEESNLYPLPTTWYWDENSNQTFETYLKRKKIFERFDQTLSIPNGNEMAKEISSLLSNVAEKCGIKKRKRQNKIGQPNNYPWFDKDCLSMKNKMKQNANLVKKQPHNKKNRESLYVLKRQYKNIVKKKKKSIKLVFWTK